MLRRAAETVATDLFVFRVNSAIVCTPTSDPMEQAPQRFAHEFATTHWSVILLAGGAQ
jgi:hypothetical protein